MVSTGTVKAIGTASPPARRQQELEETLAHSPDLQRKARMLAEASGVKQRGLALVPWEEDVRDWGTGKRMERFVSLALPLALDAGRAALQRSNTEPAELDSLTVVSCTGYVTPGLDVLVADELGMATSLHRLHLGHMGCHAALPALQTAADAAGARGATSLVICVELPSLHLQPTPTSATQLVPHALFADAAAAAVVAADGGGLELLEVVAVTDTGHKEAMRWDVTDFGFRMGLSPRVPRVLGNHVGPAVTELLGRHDLDLADVDHWAIHPGGPRIIDIIADRLGLGDEDVEVSRQVLAEHGNCSSPTVLLVLERLGPAPGQHVVAMAFGPGLTLYAALFRMR